MHDFKPILNGLLPILSSAQWMEVEDRIQRGETVAALEKALQFADENVMHVPRDTYLRVKSYLETHGSDSASPVFLNPLERTDDEMRRALRDYAAGAMQLLDYLAPYLAPGVLSSLRALIEEGAFHAALTKAMEGISPPDSVRDMVTAFLAWCDLESRFLS